MAACFSHVGLTHRHCPPLLACGAPQSVSGSKEGQRCAAQVVQMPVVVCGAAWGAAAGGRRAGTVCFSGGLH
jgi:hypothetical protein